MATTASTSTAHPTAAATRNLILDYPDLLPSAVRRLGAGPGGAPGTPDFAPGFDLPAPAADTREFYAAAVARWWTLPGYGGHALHLLDLMGNPGTHTTKTFASLVIVARAVEHIRRSGDNVCIFTPTSANKGIALRDAVARAHACGLATPEQLRVVVLAPQTTRAKFRHDALAADPALHALNPLLRYAGADPEGVKALGRAFVTEYAADAYAAGTTLWFSLDLRNYLVADAARAAFEADVSPTSVAARRWHAHAVSSAFGLLGYNAGRDVLEAAGRADPADRPGFLLVQHLGTPDMVLSLVYGDFSRDALPPYRRDNGHLAQDRAAQFPAVTDDAAEVLDPTFYTHRPVTSPAMNDLIARHGGDGIVVSRRECLDRYELLRGWFAGTARPLPADPGDLREWSLVMAGTGVANAIDRGLVPEGVEIVVHGSGSYAVGDYTPFDEGSVTPAATTAEIARAVLGR